MEQDQHNMDVTFSDSIDMTDPRTLFTATPTLDDIDLDAYPDPERYYAGQEEYGYDDDDYEKNEQDIYEPDFKYYD